MSLSSAKWLALSILIVGSTLTILFSSNSITSLQKIRVVYRHTLIFVLKTFKGLKATALQAVGQAINASGDSAVQYIDTTGWFNILRL